MAGTNSVMVCADRTVTPITNCVRVDTSQSADAVAAMEGEIKTLPGQGTGDMKGQRERKERNKSVEKSEKRNERPR